MIEKLKEMTSLNRITVIGNIGTIPKILTAGLGQLIGIQFRLAVTEIINRPNSENSIITEENTEWFTINIYGPLARNLQPILAKGARLYVEGKLQSRIYHGPDGQMRIVNNILASKVELKEYANNTP